MQPGAMQPAAAPGSVVDKSIICPPALVGKMIGPAGATIKKMAADTGAQVNLDRDIAQGGGKAVIITSADPMIREKAKAHIQNWIREPSGAGAGPMGGAPPMNPPMQPPGGMGMRPPMGGGFPQGSVPKSNPMGPPAGGPMGGAPPMRPPMNQFGGPMGGNM